MHVIYASEKLRVHKKYKTIKREILFNSLSFFLTENDNFQLNRKNYLFFTNLKVLMLYYVKQNINLFLYFKQVDFFLLKKITL